MSRRKEKEISVKTQDGVVKITKGKSMGFFPYTDYHIINCRGDEYIISEFEEGGNYNGFIVLLDCDRNKLTPNIYSQKDLIKKLAKLQFGLNSIVALLDTMKWKYNRNELIEWINYVYSIEKDNKKDIGLEY